MDMMRQYNNGVIAILEEALAEARKGKKEGVAVVLTECPSSVEEVVAPMWFRYGANTRLDEPMEDYVRQLANMIRDTHLNDTIPERECGPADRACYNAVTGPFSFDFANWLVEREMDRIAQGAPAPLKVGFWFGRDGKINFYNAYRRRMFEGVIRPMLDFVGAVECPSAATDGRVRDFYNSLDVCARFRGGEKLPRMRAPQYAIRRMTSYKGAVTITLREADEWPHRNSNTPAWLKFAADLKNRGERVIFIRDTARAYECPFEGFEDCPEASINLHLRGALYEWARMNFFVSNGPVMLAYYGNFAYRAFINMQPDGHDYLADTPSFWRKVVGVEEGSQYPWARSDQRIIWSPDTYEKISEVWEGRSVNTLLALEAAE